MTTHIEKPSGIREDASGQIDQSLSSAPESKERRTIIKKLAVGTAALAGCSVLPDKWTAPLVEFGALPVHAQTSGAAAPAAAPAAAKASPVAASGTGNFNLLFEQVVQTCADCGVWFDSAKLVIVHTMGTYNHTQRGQLLIKKTSGKIGRFRADISKVPSGASVVSATLYMHLDIHEGIANSDNSSVINVYDASGGSRGALVRKITASGDIKGKGYSKANPNVPIDFTAYAQQIHGA